MARTDQSQAASAPDGGLIDAGLRRKANGAMQKEISDRAPTPVLIPVMVKTSCHQPRLS